MLIPFSSEGFAEVDPKLVERIASIQGIVKQLEANMLSKSQVCVPTAESAAAATTAQLKLSKESAASSGTIVKRGNTTPLFRWRGTNPLCREIKLKKTVRRASVNFRLHKIIIIFGFDFFV